MRAYVIVALTSSLWAKKRSAILIIFIRNPFAYFGVDQQYLQMRTRYQVYFRSRICQAIAIRVATMV